MGAAEGTGAPPSGGQAELPMASPAQAQENGLLKEGPPSGSEGLRDPQQGLDSRIPETSKCVCGRPVTFDLRQPPVPLPSD